MRECDHKNNHINVKLRLKLVTQTLDDEKSQIENPGIYRKFFKTFYESALCHFRGYMLLRMPTNQFPLINPSKDFNW